MSSFGKPELESPQDEAPKPSARRKPRGPFSHLVNKHYPRAHEANFSVHEPAIRTSRLALLRAAGKNFIFLQLLFFALFCYIFGGLYKQNTQVDRLNVAFVDYDGGPIGGAIREAYGRLEGNKFFKLEEKTRDEYPIPSDLKHDVCKIHYWSALYVAPGASAALERALAARSVDYNKTDIMQYIWNEARYPAIVDADISANMQLLANTAKPIYAALANWSSVIATPDENTYATFANPWILASDNIQPTTQGARVVYNTLVVILLMIQEFFYLGTLNQLYDNFKIYTKLSPHRIIFFRLLISGTYCLIGSLCVTSAIWIFKTGWDVDGGQFMLTWMTFLLYAHLNFLTLDVFTVWLPPPFVPMALISWLVLNVVSILVPFELMSDFYLWSYAMPAHNVYNTLIDIWSRGCNPVLHYTLPILFFYEFSSFTIASMGIHRRCHYAIVRAEAESRAQTERIESAIVLEKKRRTEERAKFLALLEEKGLTETGEEIERMTSVEDSGKEEDRERKEIESLVEEDRRRLERIPYRRFGPSFGPSFGVGFVSGETGEVGEVQGADLGRSSTLPGRLFKRKGSIV